MSRDYRLVRLATLLTALAGAVAGLAVPLLATLRLQADSVDMGWLAVADLAPFALFALPAGPWLDRTPKRPVAMAVYALAALAALVVPLAAWGDRLSLGVLYAAGFAQGTASVIGGTALQILLMQAVGRDGLLAANASIGAVQSMLAAGGVLLAGVLAAQQGAEAVLVVSALLLLGTVLCVAGLGRELTPACAREAEPLWRGVGEGLRLIRDTPLLRALACFGSAWLMLIGGFGAQLALFSLRELAFEAREWATLSALIAVGASLGALAARRFAERRGVRSALLAGFLLTAVTMGLYPVARGLGGAALAFAIVVLGLREFGIPLYTVNYISLRQRIVPDALLGRVIGAMRGIAVSAVPLGALLWSHVAARCGIAATMYLIGMCGVALWWLARRYLPPVPADEEAVV